MEILIFPLELSVRPRAGRFVEFWNGFLDLYWRVLLDHVLPLWNIPSKFKISAICCSVMKSGAREPRETLIDKGAGPNTQICRTTETCSWNKPAKNAIGYRLGRNQLCCVFWTTSGVVSDCLRYDTPQKFRIKTWWIRGAAPPCTVDLCIGFELLHGDLLYIM